MKIQEKIELASKLLNVSVENLNACYGEIADVSATYFSIPQKGGGSLIIGDDGSVLYADSSVGYKRHLEAYLDGIRTPID
nr:hypothetical protein [uncultured Agathobaculum sp.]